MSAGREADAKAYVTPSPPLALVDVMHEAARVVARVGSASLRLVVREERVAAPKGAYVVLFDGDIIYLSPGEELDLAGIERALVFDSDAVVASPPPQSWDAVPTPAMAPFTEASRRSLPLTMHGVTARDPDASRVTLEIGGTTACVPRYWLARMLFRVGLHAPSLGYVETYEGFFYDDRGEAMRIGIRGGEPAVLSRTDALSAVDALYRAVAPDGYRER